MLSPIKILFISLNQDDAWHLNAERQLNNLFKPQFTITNCDFTAIEKSVIAEDQNIIICSGKVFSNSYEQIKSFLELRSTSWFAVLSSAYYLHRASSLGAKHVIDKLNFARDFGKFIGLYLSSYEDFSLEAGLQE